MLLNTGQVSVALSSLVALVFTIILFLSGYILQQQTVRDLRAALQPQVIPPKTTDVDLPWLLAAGTQKGSKYWEARGLVDAVLGEILDEEQKFKESARNTESQDTEMKQSPRGTTRRQKQKQRESLQRQRESSQPSTKNPQHSQIQLSRAARRKLIKSQILYEEEKERSEDAQKGYRWHFW